MLSLELTLNLPDPLAQEAEAAGLLKAEAIEALLRAEMQRRKVNELFSAADRLAELDLPPLSQVEIEAEISAARAERRTSGASGS